MNSQENIKWIFIYREGFIGSLILKLSKKTFFQPLKGLEGELFRTRTLKPSKEFNMLKRRNIKQ